MDKIEMPKAARSDSFERAVVAERENKKKIAKDLLGNAGIFVGIFIIFAVIVIVTTDIKITSFEDAAVLGLDFFLLLFCSYSMYLTCSDSGMRHGRKTDTYTQALITFNAKKKALLDATNQEKLCEFCRYYIETELKEARVAVLSLAGISYDEYKDKWLGTDDLTVNRSESLSKAKKQAIIHANRIKPIRLTPEMILARGRGNSRRAPLGIAPEAKKKAAFGMKFATSIATSLLFSTITLSLIEEPTWTMIASCAMKLLAVVMNGFAGYKLGFENVVFDTSNYIESQIALIDQAMQFCESGENA